MHLEKIEIFGFKSFADKTVIHFSKPVTAIVGPNGCGKSNVVDAFRWVLGGPTAKSLRSDKMVDVIFSGTEKRPPLNYAQISLTFTKTGDQTLSADYQEICISRRLYRNGDSEWLINRNPVRLKDVHQLLWEAGLGKNAFYIFEQGKLDDLIVSTPEERRNIFEEAAKIMHFKEKRREAYRKLAQVEENLKRVLDIQAEVNKQIESLKKQAEEAERYKKQKEDLETLDQSLIIAKWQNNQKQQESLAEVLKQKSEDQEKIKTQIKEFEDKVKNLKEQFHTQSEHAKNAYEEYFEVKKSKEMASFEFKTHKKRLDELLTQIGSLKQALQQFHQKHLQEHKTYLENLNKLENHQNNLSALIKEHQNSLSQMQELEAKVSEVSEERKESQKKLMQLVSSSNDLQGQLSKTCIQLDNLTERQASLIHQEKTCTMRFLERQELFQSASSKYAQAALENTALQKEIADITLEIKEKKTHIDEIREKLKVISDEVTSKNAKVNLLQKLKDEFDGYGKATQALLRSSKEPSHPLYDKISPLSEWIIPHKGYEVCLSSLLGPYLQTIITQTQQDLETILNYAREKKLQGFSILCLEHLPKLDAPTTQKWAQSNLVSDHFLSHIQEGDSFSNLTPFTLIHKEFFVDDKKVLHHLTQDKNNLFLRENELRSIYQELIKIEQEKQILQEAYNQQNQEFKKLSDVQSQKQSREQQLRMTLRENELKVKSYEEELRNLQESAQEFQNKKLSLSESLQELENKKKELASRTQTEQQVRSEHESHFKKIENLFEQHFQTLSEKRSLRQSLESRIKNAEKEAQNLQELIKIFESKSLDFEEQIEKMNADIEEKQKNLEHLESQNPLFQEQEAELIKKLEESNEQYLSFEKALEELESEQLILDQNLASQRIQLETLQNEHHEINNKSSQLIAENNLYFSEITEKFQLDLDEVIEFNIDPSFSIHKAEREVKSLRRSVEGFTEINLKAVADCKEQEERFVFLQSQMDDLAASKDKLIEIITELDNTSRQLFSETFENIRTHFKRNYALLFNGGEADLKLNTDVDILDAGVEIVAQPPGKKIRSIQQMSGGEKCLTALALLFALFETQSIPFCILDEVDAPLDDTNIERFTNALKQFVKNHQFIIITHNKRTMAIADILLGISMEEKGVTKVIPFEFNNQPTQTDTPSAALTNH